MYEKYFKRSVDLFGSIILLCTLSPIIIITIIISLFCHGKKIFFLQERIGKGNVKFKVIKLKTMSDATDEKGQLLSDDERQTRFGSFMRKYSLDELLQLINIIKGDMSLVGPRPFMERYVADCTEQQLRRHDVRPGVTGLAQVCGRNAISYEKRFKYDVFYVTNISFGFDLKILWDTFKSLIGIYKVKNTIDYDPFIEEQYR